MPPANPPTLVSLLTPVGEGGISVIALSGPRAVPIALSLFRPPRSPSLDWPQPGRLYYGHLYDGDEMLDEVLIAFCSAEESTTAHEMVEINCHGGIGPADAVIQALVRRGAVEVDARGLLQSAVDSQKLDAIQAQAAFLLPTAPSARAAALLLAQSRGALSREMSRIAALLASGTVPPARDALLALIQRWDTARKLLNPPVVVLAGKTNVGKSTLLNALLGYDRAIACDQPGTTRDHVSDHLGSMSALLQIVDTAGLHGPADSLSREAERRTLALLHEADVIVFLFDAAGPLSREESALLARLSPRPLIPVASKADLGSGPAAEEAHRITRVRPIRVSSLTRSGIQELEHEISRLAALPSGPADLPSPFTIGQAGALREAVALLDSGSPPEEVARRLLRLKDEPAAHPHH